MEHAFDWGPYGAKGLGETPIIAVAPAVTAAIAPRDGRAPPRDPRHPRARVGRVAPERAGRGRKRRLKRTPRLLAVALALTALSSVRAADEQAVPVIDPRALAAHMRFLSDDLLQGRAHRQRGIRDRGPLRGHAVRGRGLEPAGTQGFLQPVALRSAELDAQRSLLRLTIPGASTTTLRHLDQVLILPSFARTQDDLQGPVVFVGYGITAPDLRHDDYAGADVAGKVVAVLQGAPTGFPDVLRAHHCSPRQKAENAAAHGAIGLLSLASPQEQVPWRLYVRWARMPALRWVYGDEVEDALPALHGAAVLGTNVADRILSGAGRTPADVYARAAAGEHQAFATGTRVTLRTVTRHRVVESRNVAAVLRGTDPALRAQTVVFSAHLDHLGLGEPMDGDRIYNGAVDNASGVAAVIEIARAMARTAGPPRRSVLFLAVTGEEDGPSRVGLLRAPSTVPAGTIVADVNIDSLGLLLPSADVAGIGADSSTLGETLQRAALRLGVEISPDPVPAQVLFIRSDQYSFVRQGVPSVFLNSGFKPLHAGDDPAAQFERWLGTVYHSPKDDMAQQPLDLFAGARLARLNLLLGLLVADQPERPQWKPGDFFGRTYGGAQRRGELDGGHDRSRVHGQRAAGARAHAQRRAAARPAARRAAPHRRQGRVRQGRVRRLHRAGGRPAGGLVPDDGVPGRRQRGGDGRGPGRRQHAASAAGCVHRPRRRAVRDLHPRHADGRQGAARRRQRALAGEGPPGPGRQPVPLYRLHEDLRGGGAGRAHAGAAGGGARPRGRRARLLPPALARRRHRDPGPARGRGAPDRRRHRHPRQGQGRRSRTARCSSTCRRCRS